MSPERRSDTEEETAGPPRVPRGVVALGTVSLFMDLSSEIYHGLLPVFLTSTLGAGAEVLGLIEGVAEATASVTKAFAGALSDAVGRRKPLLLAGYGLASVVKPLFALATLPVHVFAARFLDRIGKGIRGAPRDALVADLTPQSVRGAAFGLRQSLDTVGALLGPLAAVFLMLALGARVRTVFWIAVLPALVCVSVLALFVHEPSGPGGVARKGRRIRWADVPRLGRSTSGAILFAGWITLARSSEAFLILRAHQMGLSASLAPLSLAVLSATYAATAWPAGRLADAVGRKVCLALGLAVLVVADATVAAAGTLAVVLVGTALWGVHLGLTQAVLSAWVADAAPEELRGSAFGLLHLVSGLALLVASLGAGVLWQAVSPAAPFLAGAAVAAVGLLLLLARRPARVP